SLAKLPTGECAYIGDKINRDILGAKRAGYSLAVQIKHQYDNGEIDEGATPDAIITTMDELMPLLESKIEKDHSYSGKTFKAGIKALFFDAGDILYFRPNKNAHFNKFLEEVNAAPVENIENELLKYRHMAFTGQMKRLDYYEKVVHLHGIRESDSVAKGVNALSLDDNTVEIVSGVPETIRELKQRGFLLGIITDTALPYSKKLKWFEEHGFGNVWDTIISSCELGIRKPHPSMYEKALSLTGTSPDQAIFVGHKKSELDGARQAGMKTIAFNHEEGVVADYYIKEFADLLGISCLNTKLV
ncbi:MAG: HAD-IA family hydrolase, partial [Anaerolineaceae bacterium]|nr:HAD-IA family hydrolase [Anaerolineaceae bacterium]